MFHLFNNVYLEHVQFYHSQFTHVIIPSEESSHPVSKIANVDLGRIPGIEEFLNMHHEGKLDNFWEWLLSESHEEPFVVFVDQKLYTRLQLQFWKSIFEDGTAEDIYKLYRFFCNDKLIKRLLSVERPRNLFGETQPLLILTKDEFNTEFENMTRSEALLVMDKSQLSFEYLLANYYLAPESPLAMKFMEKVEDLSWKAFFDNMSILRNEILNSFYDIKRIFPDADIDFYNFESIEKFVKNEPRLKWISDLKFHDRVRNHVTRYYNKEIFLHLTREMAKAVLQSPEVSGDLIEKVIDCDDQIKIINCVFDKKYKELLLDNINKKFGCFFISDDLNNRSNQLLPLFIYEKIREQKIDDLSFLKIKQV